MSAPQPIAPDLWTDEAEPRLIGGRRADGTIVFPMPEGEAGASFEAVPLSRRGLLWSWTRQDFRPKPPFAGPEPFEPFLLGYVELPSQVIVESRLVDAELEELFIGLPMSLAIVPFDEERTTFAFRPERAV